MGRLEQVQQKAKLGGVEVGRLQEGMERIGLGHRSCQSCSRRAGHLVENLIPALGSDPMISNFETEHNPEWPIGRHVCASSGVD